MVRSEPHPTIPSLAKGNPALLRAIFPIAPPPGRAVHHDGPQPAISVASRGGVLTGLPLNTLSSTQGPWNRCRHIHLTEEGEQLVGIAEQILDLSEQASSTRASPSSPATLSGVVRLSAPHSFARLFLSEPIQQLMAEHPDLNIDLILEDSISELVNERVIYLIQFLV